MKRNVTKLKFIEEVNYRDPPPPKKKKSQTCFGKNKMAECYILNYVEIVTENAKINV